MLIETIEAETRPMLYVTRSASMDPNDIAATMAAAFDAMVAFLGTSGVHPAGPPLAVYHDWDEEAGRMTIDVGFPVACCDTTKARGEIHAGQTPSGKALKAVHHGPYARLREAYGAIEAQIARRGLAMPATAWEVYLSDPDTTRAEDLVTEIYMPIA